MPGALAAKGGQILDKFVSSCLHVLRRGCVLGTLWVLALAAGCSGDDDARALAPPPADLVLTNGRIYTLDPAQPWVQAVAVREGRFVARGSAEDMRSLTGSATRVVDLGGAMAMPGINDAHVHPVRGAMEMLYRCQFAFTATPDEVAAALRACIAATPDAQWISGGRWGSGFFDEHRIESPRAFLDAIASDRAIVLVDDSGHNAWVNSLALARFGISADTPDPEGGAIVRDADGEPNGLLQETAAKAAFAKTPEPTQQQYLAAVRKSVEVMNAFGITGMKDATAIEGSFGAYAELARAGALSMHTDLAISTVYGRREQPLAADVLDGFERARREHRGGELTLDTVKIYLDGVPTSARTAAMLAPYRPADGHADGGTGDLHVEADVLAADLVALGSRGFRVKMHVAGDRSVRVALDAIAQARAASGRNWPAHELAHAGYIDAADLPRFAALGAVADIAPVLWHPSPIIASVIAAVGQRGEHYWPVRALLDSGAMVAAGSDWPSAVPSANPWVGIEALVTRADPYSKTPGTLWPEQAVRLEEAIRIYTVNGAKALGREQITGSIEVGKSADLIVLDRNLFEVPATDVGETRVLETWFGGRAVHGIHAAPVAG